MASTSRSPSPHPQGFAAARLDEFGAKLCDPASGLAGIRSELIRLKKWDDLFGYELTAQFFGENGTLTRTADRVKVGVRNGRTAGDMKIICETLTRFYRLMNFPLTSVSTLSAHAHPRFSSAEERDDFLRRFAYTPMVAKPAALGYVQVLDWEKEVRVLIEQSNVVQDAVFVMWDTQFTNDQEWETFLPKLSTLMDEAANFFDLSFGPLREKV